MALGAGSDTILRRDGFPRAVGARRVGAQVRARVVGLAGRAVGLAERAVASPRLERLDRLGLVGAIAFGLIFGLGWALEIVHGPNDARAYFGATDFGNLYPESLMDPQGYFYPPVLAQALVPIRVIGWPAFIVLWMTGSAVAAWYVLRWATLPVLGLGFLALALPLPRPFIAYFAEVVIGGVSPFLAAAVIAGLRRPGFWAVPLLTKMGPGIGLLWHVFRGEWRAARIALGVTLLVGGVSFALAPAAWFEYLDFGLRTYGTPAIVPWIGPPLPVRLAAAALIVLWGARTNHPWAVPIAAGIAIPGLYAWSFLLLWTGAVVMAVRARQPGAEVGV